MTKIAIVGSGIAGLGAAYVLDPYYDVVLYEAQDRLGGHANTVTVQDPVAGPLGIDTGFIVHNDRNYPNLVRLFDELGVEIQDTDMSFGVDHREAAISYRATNIATLFAHRRNALTPGYWRMLRDIPRFWRAASRLLDHPDPSISLNDFLETGAFSSEFVNWHLMPMGSAIWSASPATFGAFPAVSLLTFLHNHGLLGIGRRPQWRTVHGGSSNYVNRIASELKAEVRTSSPVVNLIRDGATVELSTPRGTDQFDAAILACHPDQSLKLLANPSQDETSILGAIKYQPNTATLHTDESVLPTTVRSQAAWNYRVERGAELPTVTYDLTALQRLAGSRRYLVSLNMDHLIDQSRVIERFEYAHPVFNNDAITAATRLDVLNGSNLVYYAGAWVGHGFHEDGLVSALRVCEKLGVCW